MMTSPTTFMILTKSYAVATIQLVAFPFQGLDTIKGFYKLLGSLPSASSQRYYEYQKQ